MRPEPVLALGLLKQGAFFFFQAEDGIRDVAVTGVQTCALPIFMLNQDDFAKGRDRRKGEGCRVWVSTVQDITAIAARVRATGWPLDREPSETPWGDWAFALTDPDGFKITVIQE